MHTQTITEPILIKVDFNVWFFHLAGNRKLKILSLERPNMVLMKKGVQSIIGCLKSSKTYLLWKKKKKGVFVSHFKLQMCNIISYLHQLTNWLKSNWVYVHPLFSYGWTSDKGQVVMTMASPCSMEAMDQGDRRNFLSNSF